MDNTPKKRRRILLTTLLIDQTGQYVTLPIRLPANAGRITGVMVTGQAQNMGLDGRTAWVLYGAPGQVPGAVLERWLDAVTYNRVPGGIRFLTVDRNAAEGFVALLSDELGLSLVRPPAGQSVYVFVHKVAGTPIFTNAFGQAVSPVRVPSQHLAQASSYRNPEILAYELPVDTAINFPPTFIF